MLSKGKTNKQTKTKTNQPNKPKQQTNKQTNKQTKQYQKNPTNPFVAILNCWLFGCWFFPECLTNTCRIFNWMTKNQIILGCYFGAVGSQQRFPSSP